jgi:ribosomal protein L11 methyltransferase
MLELFPEGFEEVDRGGSTELVAYTDARGEEKLWLAFGGAHGSDVEAGWETRWRDFHRPVRVGPLWVGPPWESPPRDALAVVVDPGRAFGTGAHPTTQLCLELLLDGPRGSLLDVGCGSGVLAIAAARLGYGPLTAVDVEDAAVAATRANARANEVEVDVRRADATTGALPPADLAVVNVSYELVTTIVPRLDVSRAITSGYLVRDEPGLEGFRGLDRRERDGWAADLLERI